ncbi:hypothetical protein ARMGADRAFT_1083206 [Armillaria gallica]|uniref:Retrotransposon gag domain-containing protein n=1 Tax=Armillaria gallica TaxID=47427 RepID=A0A2H3D7K1_ARMGA|nr:hypothetical protein ARMGADRAFT_1083206 [Armillaria gallica]
MPAIGTTTTRRITIVVLAAFFSAAAILFLIVLCLIAYDTAGIEEAEEDARAALPFHYIPQHHLIPEPSLTLLPEARTHHRPLHPIPSAAATAPHMNPTPPPTPTEEDVVLFDNLAILLTELLLCITALGIALAAITTTVTASLLTLNPDQDWLARALQNMNQPPPPRCPQRATTAPPTAIHSAGRRGEHQDPDYPTIGRWIGEAIQPLLDIQWDQPVKLPFHDLHPDFELPDAPLELNPVPSYEVRDPHELPRAPAPSPSPSAPGYQRIPTPTPTPMSLEPLSDDDEFLTPRPSLILSPTHTQIGQTTTLSTQEGRTTSGPSSRRSTESSSAPTEVPRGKSDDRTSSSDSSGPILKNPESTWTSTLLSRVAIHSWESKLPPAWQPGSTPTRPDSFTHPALGIEFPTHDQGPPAPRSSSRPTSAPWQYSTKNGHENRGFRLDEETFGAALRDAAHDWETYHGKGTSVLIAGADRDKQMGEGSGQPGPANPEELAQHYATALLQIAQMRTTENDLRDQLTTAQNVNRGRPPGRQLDLDRYSVARPPTWQGPPNAGLTGTWNAAEPPAAAGVKPILMEKPRKFAGKHDDIEQFVGDCITYFEVFRQYFMDVPSRTIVLLTSLLEGDTEDWWVHKRPDYWHVPRWNDADFDQGPRYRYPNWATFIREFHEEFRDAAVEETHERKMGEIKMAGKTATKFFREIEREAKLAN